MPVVMCTLLQFHFHDVSCRLVAWVQRVWLKIAKLQSPDRRVLVITYGPTRVDQHAILICCSRSINLLCWLERRRERIKDSYIELHKQHQRHVFSSATGTRTRVTRVRAEYPNQIDYS